MAARVSFKDIILVLFMMHMPMVANAGSLPVVECRGIIAGGYGTVRIFPDRGDGAIHGEATYSWQKDNTIGGQMQLGGGNFIPFTGKLESDGTATLYRPDGTVWYHNVTVQDNRFNGRWVNAANTAPANWPCTPYKTQ